MRVLTLVFGLVALTKGVLLVRDQEGVQRRSHQVIRVVPEPFRDEAHREVDRAYDLARKGPGGLKALGWLTVAVGVLAILKAISGK